MARTASFTRSSVSRAAAASVLMAGVLLVSHSPAHASVVLMEDFEAYASGSNLGGQGGWTGTGLAVRIGDSSPLGSQVADGLVYQPGYNFAVARHSLGASLSALGSQTSLNFDAYAVAPGSSHNAWLGFTPASDNLNDGWADTGMGNGFLVWDYDWNQGWNFNYVEPSEGVNVNNYTGVGAGGNKEVHLGIQVDAASHEVWGTYDFGSGVQSTAHYAITDATLAKFNTLNLGFDFRGTRGVYMDNISVQTVPEPEMAWLMLAGLPLLARSRRQAAKA